MVAETPTFQKCISEKYHGFIAYMRHMNELWKNEKFISFNGVQIPQVGLEGLQTSHKSTYGAEGAVEKFFSSIIFAQN